MNHRNRERLPRLQSWFYNRADPLQKQEFQDVRCDEWLREHPLRGNAKRHVDYDPSTLPYYLTCTLERRKQFNAGMVSLGQKHPLNVDRHIVLTPVAQRESRLPNETFPVYNWVLYAVSGWIDEGRRRLGNRDIDAELTALIQNNFQPPQ